MVRKLFVLTLASEPRTRESYGPPKALYNLAGSPLFSHLLQAISPLAPDKVYLATNIERELVYSVLEKTSEQVHVEVIDHRNLRDTFSNIIKSSDIKQRERVTLLITYSDIPLITPATLSDFIRVHTASKALCTAVTSDVRKHIFPNCVISDSNLKQHSIKIDKGVYGTRANTKKVKNTVICYIDASLLKGVLTSLPATSIEESQLDLVCNSRGIREFCKVLTYNSYELLRVSNNKDLAFMERLLRIKTIDRLMLQNGIFVIDPDHTYVSIQASIGSNTTLFPNVHIEGNTVIGRGCEIRSGCRIVDSRIGDNVVVKDHSIIIESDVGNNCHIGPFTHLRMGANLEEGVVVGNFVEVKKSKLGNGVKAKHLAYLGDATIGKKTNIGAGTITCNYDGVNRQSTVIEDNVRIGANTMLVAPVHVHSGSITAAGAVITEDVPPNTMVAGVPAVVKKHLKSK